MEKSKLEWNVIVGSNREEEEEGMEKPENEVKSRN